MTKTLKPVLALSIAALTLLAGCAKSEANTAYSKAKQDVKSKLSVKSFDKAFFTHMDVNKYLKSDDAKSLSESDKKELKENGNVVTVTYTFTLKDNTQQIWDCTYSTKSKKMHNGVSVVAVGTLFTSVNDAYEGARKAASNVEGTYTTFGDLKK